MSVGWGIVGAGGVANANVAPAIAALEGAELVGVVDIDQERARACAEKHGGRPYSTYEELLADAAVNVVYIATPNALHADQIVAAAKAGKHVFAEKPLATTIDDAFRAVEACERASVKLGIDFQTRHHEGIEEVRRTIRSGEIGEVLVVQCEVSPGRHELRGWRTEPLIAGLGTTNNLGVHAYDLLRYLLGAEIEEVSVLTNAGRRHELETIALSLFRFDNGALAYVNANQAVADYQPDLTVYGTEGRIVGRGITRPFVERCTISILSRGEERTIGAQTKDAYSRSVAAFNRTVARGEEPNPSGLDGLRSVELTDAMARSAHEGRTVAVRNERNRP